MAYEPLPILPPPSLVQRVQLIYLGRQYHLDAHPSHLLSLLLLLHHPQLPFGSVLLIRTWKSSRKLLSRSECHRSARKIAPVHPRGRLSTHAHQHLERRLRLAAPHTRRGYEHPRLSRSPPLRGGRPPRNRVLYRLPSNHLQGLTAPRRPRGSEKLSLLPLPRLVAYHHHHVRDTQLPNPQRALILPPWSRLVPRSERVHA